MVISVTFVQNKNIKILTTYSTSSDKLWKKIGSWINKHCTPSFKVKNKSEIDQLYHETQKLYEALAILKFYGDNYEQVKLDVAADDLEEKITAFVEDKTVIETPKVVEVEAPQTDLEEETAVKEEPVAVEEIDTKEETVEEPVVVGEITIEEDEIEEEPIAEFKSDFDFEPIFELAADTIDDEETATEEIVQEVEVKVETPKQETKQISFEDLLGENYTEPVFVKPNDIVVPDSLKNVIDENHYR